MPPDPCRAERGRLRISAEQHPSGVSWVGLCVGLLQCRLLFGLFLIVVVYWWVVYWWVVYWFPVVPFVNKSIKRFGQKTPKFRSMCNVSCVATPVSGCAANEPVLSFPSAYFN